MYTNSSGKATSKYVQKNIWPTAFSPEEIGNSCLASELCPLSYVKHARSTPEVADADAVASNWCNSVVTLWWHYLFRRRRYMELHFFGYLFNIRICLQFSVVCRLSTNISAVNMVLWEPNLDYRHGCLRFLL